MPGRHIQHDFSDYGVLRKMDTTWEGVVFTHVIIDYFYTPNYWHEERFKEEPLAWTTADRYAPSTSGIHVLH